MFLHKDDHQDSLVYLEVFMISWQYGVVSSASAGAMWRNCSCWDSNRSSAFQRWRSRGLGATRAGVFSNSSSQKRVDTTRRQVHVRAASESPYDILGVPPSATEADIKRAYRKLALQHHPDVNKAPDAQQKFMSIKNAYQTLVDPLSRSKYDSTTRSTSTDPFTWGYSTPREEDQEDFYGIGDFWNDLQISFEEFFNDLQADFNRGEASGNPKSLWEELADIGEEFVEFLEKELNIVNETNQPMEEKENMNGSNSKKEHRFNFDGMDTQQQSKKLEKEINDIEELLAKLKDELGL